MANIVELKDKNGNKCYPITKGQAVYFDNGTNVSEFKDTVINTINLTASKTDGYFINANGQKTQSSTGYAYSGPIPVYYGKKYRYIATGTTAVSAISLCDSIGDTIKSVHTFPSDNVTNTFIFKPDFDGYIYVSYESSEKVLLEEIADNIIEDSFNKKVDSNLFINLIKGESFAPGKTFIWTDNETKAITYFKCVPGEYIYVKVPSLPYIGTVYIIEKEQYTSTTDLVKTTTINKGLSSIIKLSSTTNYVFVQINGASDISLYDPSDYAPFICYLDSFYNNLSNIRTNDAELINDNLYSISILKVGKDWGGYNNNAKATFSVSTLPGMKYYFKAEENSSVDYIDVIQFNSDSQNIKVQRVQLGNGTYFETVSAASKITVQFTAKTSFSTADFVEYNIEMYPIATGDRESSSLHRINTNNLFDSSKIQYGVTWAGTEDAKKAIQIIPAEPNTCYRIDLPIYFSMNQVVIIEKSMDSHSYMIGALKSTTMSFGNSYRLVTTPETGYIYLQFESKSNLIYPELDNISIGIYKDADKGELAEEEAVTNSLSLNKMNLANIQMVKVGIAWTYESNDSKAIMYIDVEPNAEYYYEIPASNLIGSVDFIQRGWKSKYSPALASNNYLSMSSGTFVTVDDAKCICIQLNGTETLNINKVKNFNIYVCKGSHRAQTNIVEYLKRDNFETFRELADSQSVFKSRVGGYEFVSNTDAPVVYKHTQEAWPEEYYDVNSTVKQYSTINYTRTIPEEYSCNKLPQHEIDFTPETGFVRIIAGKGNDDIFFVSKVASNGNPPIGDTRYNTLEVTTDFINFATVIHGSDVSGDGIVIPNVSNINVLCVKQFINGDYLLGLLGYDTVQAVSYTMFYLLSEDMTEVTKCQYVNFDNQIVDMTDEFYNGVYDWHMSLFGSKALVTTYGDRTPERDYGRVWYTEDNGKNWKQVFQTNNHYQDGATTTITQTHTHGVMIDPYTGRLYVLAGEDNRNIFWTDKGIDATDDDWYVIDMVNQPVYNFQTGTQIVNGYAFKDSLIFGSDTFGVGAIFRINKLKNGKHSHVEAAHELLPNKYRGTYYCGGGMSRRDLNSPLLVCMTKENVTLTEEDNEGLNAAHKGRVIATYDGVNFTEIWEDDTYGSHPVYIDGQATTRNFAYCTRGMNAWLLKNGNMIIAYAGTGRDYHYFGGDPLFSVRGFDNICCKVRVINNAEKYL